MKQRILVIDDDRIVADTLNLIFLANGYDSHARYSATDGLACARTLGPALVVCDVTLPDVSGLEVAEAISHELPGCKMLMFTAYSSNAIKVEMQASRLHLPLKLLRKPCRPEELLRETTALLHETSALLHEA